MVSTRPHPALPFFVWGLAATAAVALAASWIAIPIKFDATLVVLAALALVAEWATFTSFKGGDIAISYPITVATFVIYGPTAAAVVAVLTSLLATAQLRQAPIKVAFNVSASVAVELAAAWSYVFSLTLLAPNQPITLTSTTEFAQWPTLVGPILLASIVTVLLNTLLVVVVLWLAERTSPAASFRHAGLGVFSVLHLVMGLVGLAVALVTVQFNWVGLVVFVFPLLAARQIFQTSARLQQDYPATVRILVRSIEAKDEYTRGHSERVADYAARFGTFLSVKEREAERIQFAAMLHDLGKMGVRAEVLNKPAQLTAEEYSEMKRHPVAGLEIVSRIPGTEDLLPVIRHHHERIDGHGYPDGICGDSIPYGSRLLAVCDTYDAMTSSRPYRPAMSVEEATAELEAVAGTQLDSSLARAFVAMIEGGEDRES